MLLYLPKLIVSNINKGRTWINMYKSAWLILLLVIISANLNGQSTSAGGGSATILSPVWAQASFTTAVVKRGAAQSETTSTFGWTSKKAVERNIFLLPLLKTKIAFATLTVSSLSVYDLTFLPVTPLQSFAPDAMIAYSFNADEHFVTGVSKANGWVQLSAIVAMTTNQKSGLYQLSGVNVVVNYN